MRRGQDVLARSSPEAVENGDIQFVPKQYETCTSDAIFRTGVSPVSCGSPYCIPAWYDNEGNGVHVGRTEDEVRQENNLSTALRRDEDVRSTPFSPRCGLPGWLKTPMRCVSSAPDQRDGFRFRHHLLLLPATIMMTHALHQR